MTFCAQSLEVWGADFLSVGKPREEWEPGGAPIVERVQALREAHAAGISTWVTLPPLAFPAELIELVESLRADVDAWRIGNPPPGEPPPKPIVGQRIGFVDADTALAHLRHMVERGLKHQIRRRDEMKIWFPEEKERREKRRTDEGRRMKQGKEANHRSLALCREVSHDRKANPRGTLSAAGF